MVQVQHRTETGSQPQTLTARIHAEMDHAYLSRWLQAPVLESLQFLLASAIVRAADLTAEKRDTLISTLMLIYHGLAVHDDIEVLAAREDERYRQLGVLAGDYYSSKYYRLLAQAGLIEEIGIFARAIQKVNEARAELERDPLDFTLTPERYLELHTIIHSTLLHSLRAMYLPDLPLWEDLVTQLARAAVLAKEWQIAPQIPLQRNLANLLAWRQATSEERKWWKQVLAGKNHDQNKLVSLHVKYGTSSSVFQQMEDEIALVEHTALLSKAHDLLEDLREVFNQLTEVRPIARHLGEEA